METDLDTGKFGLSLAHRVRIGAFVESLDEILEWACEIY